MAHDDNNAEIFSRPNTDARIYDFEQFTLWADTPGRQGFRSRMTFGERNGAARITVFPNTEPRTDIVWIGMAPLVFMEFLDRFEAIVRGEAGKSSKLANMGAGPNAPKGKAPRDEDLVVRNTLHFGKSQEGVCWLAVEQQGVPNIRFTILPSSWHTFFREDGTAITPKEASAAQALALVKTLRGIYMPFFGRLRPYQERQAGGRAKEAAPAGDTAPMTTFGEDVTFG